MQTTQEGGTAWRERLLWPAIALVSVLSAAVVGAWVTGTALGPLTGSVEDASGRSVAFLGRVGDLFPLGFAFSAGMVASVNPCGFALLPAYLGLYLGDRSGAQPDRDLMWRLQRGVLVALTVTISFVLLFAGVGIPIGLGAQWLVGVFPWIGLGVGVLLAGAGAYLLGGGELYTTLATRLSSRIGGSATEGNNLRGYFTFGIGYGIASLSCTLPVFLAVVGGTFTTDTFLGSLWQFLLYGFGMGTVILFLTLGMALFRGAAARWLQRAVPYTHAVSAALLLLAGSFIVYYWLSVGGLLAQVA